MTAEAVQCELFPSEPALDAAALRAFLNQGGRRPVNVALTRNAVSMVSVAFPADGPVRLRLHEEFRNAPAHVLEALRKYLRTRRRDAWRVVAAFAESIDGSASRPAPAPLRRRGRVYDLGRLAAEVNRGFFAGRVKCRVGWGRRPKISAGSGRRCRRRSIRYGSWVPSTRTIRINPLLDDARVPEEFVRYIVYHEMLHAVIPAQVANGRRYSHHAHFRKLEQRFPDWERMQTLSRELLDVLR